MSDEFSNPGVSRERSDISARLVAWVLAAVAGLIGATLGALWLFFGYLDGRERRAKSDAAPLVAAENERQAQLAPEDQLRRHADGRPLLEGLPPDNPVHRGGPWRKHTPEAQAEAERERIEGYGWVDRGKRTVHVPIERAQRLALEQRSKHLPSRRPEQP